MRKLFFLSIILFSLACQSSDSANYTEKSIQSEAQSQPPQAAPEKTKNNDLVDIRKIIKRAQIRMEVKNLDASSVRIQNFVQQFDGFISNLNLSNSNYQLNSKISIRVPSSNFHELLDSIKHQAIFLQSERIHTNDVTEEYLDIQTRLKTKKEVRDRYVAILRNRAKSVEDVLLAEEKIRVIQEEIEAAEGRLKYLSTNVSLSTITVDLFQKIEFKPSPETYTNTFWNKLGRSFKSGLSFIEDLTLNLIAIWPLLLILGLLFGFRKRLFRRFRG